LRFGVPKIIECVDASAAFSRSTCPVWVVAVSCLELGWRHSQIVSYARFQFASCTFTSEYSQLASISARSAGYSEWRDAHTNIIFLKEGRCKATWKREFNLPWREAGQPDHHDDKVDSDQWAVNKELSLSRPLPKIIECVDASAAFSRSTGEGCSSSSSSLLSLQVLEGP